jgi:hypothetical protein
VTPTFHSLRDMFGVSNCKDGQGDVPLLHRFAEAAICDVTTCCRKSDLAARIPGSRVSQGCPYRGTGFLAILFAGVNFCTPRSVLQVAKGPSLRKAPKTPRAIGGEEHIGTTNHSLPHSCVESRFRFCDSPATYN